MAAIDVEESDVVIVGARLAGTAAAIPLVRAGRKVIVLDKSRFPSDQLSTHVLVPSGVSELQHMGALPRILRLDPARTRYLGVQVDDVRLRERFAPVDGIDYGLCVPRLEQDMCLVETAREADVDVRERCMFEDVIWRDGRVAGVRYRHDGETRVIRAPLVIGADGRRSKVAAAVGEWQPYRGSQNGRGFVFRYMDDPKVGTIEHETFGLYRPGARTVLTLPSSPRGRLLVVFMAPVDDIPRFQRGGDQFWWDALSEDPGLAERTTGATDLSPLRSTTKLVSYYRRSSGPGWVLAGDAGHFKDPVAGQGQRDALHHGRLLGEVVRGSLDDPSALDSALGRWEQHRDRDTRSTYHWANRESRPDAPSPLVREVFRTFEGDDGPDVSDTFNRVRKIEQVIGPRKLIRGATRALLARGADRKAILREIAREIPIELGIRWEKCFGGFRRTGWGPSERPGWSLGEPPATRLGEAVRSPTTETA